MEYKDREKIDYLCKHLAQDIDINRLWPKLLEHQIFNRDDVNIPNWKVCFFIKTTSYFLKKKRQNTFGYFFVN